MTAYVYIIGAEGAGGFRTYVGWTLELERRLAQHNGQSNGGAKSTRGRSWHLLYAEKLPDRIEAMRREYHLKRDRGLRRDISNFYQSAPLVKS